MKLIKRSENYSERYNQIVQEAQLAENSSVRWCMVIKPYGFAIRENIRNILDAMFKATWHVNAYFPLFIPKSFLSKEAEHVEHFAKECAIVTHYRLKLNDEKKLVVDPEAKLDEELIVRPTSETIIRDSYKNRIHSYRDLPLLINQRANVVRWEMRTRIFLRTTEFLRQEWHTAHASKKEAEKETIKMLNVYSDFASNYMAMYHFIGQKPEHEKFAGADRTYGIEPMMQDGKALQAWTSHNLGQSFAKAFDVKFMNEKNELEYVWATSRWVSTRLLWGLIMAHSDDNWLILPPALAPIHVVVVPFFKTQEELKEIKKYLKPITKKLEKMNLIFDSKVLKKYKIKIEIKIDEDDQKSPWWKFNEWELKWVPVRLTVGSKEMAENKVEIYRRDTQEKVLVEINDVAKKVEELLYEIQKNIYDKHEKFTKENTFVVNDYNEFKDKIEKWFVLAHRDGTTETAMKIQDETKATIRCFLPNDEKEIGKCIYSGKESKGRVLFAKAY